MISLNECERLAQTDELFENSTFTGFFPIGEKKCKWLDAYLGMFEVESLDVFLTVYLVNKRFPDLLVTEPIAEIKHE